jgi:hypothetical protein
VTTQKWLETIANFVAIQAREKFCRWHMSDIPMVEFFALKKTFWPNICVGCGFQILNIRQYTCFAVTVALSV